jgi:Tfp pilus assembly protein PilN
VRPIDINLASNPFRNDKPIWLVLVLAAALAFGFTGYNAWAYLSAGSRQTQLEQEIAGHRKRMHAMKQEADKLQAALAKVDQETLTSQAQFVSSILDQRNFSWTRLFNALEQVTPWDVKLVSIRPQFEVLNRRTGEGRFRIQVSGIGRTFDSFLDLQEALQAAEMFSEVTPEEYERQGDEIVDFNMAFTYRPPPEVPGGGADELAGGSEGKAGSPAEIGEAGPLLEQGPADAAAGDESVAPATARGAARAGNDPPATAAPAAAVPGAKAGSGRGAAAPGGEAAASGANVDGNLGVPVGSGTPATGVANIEAPGEARKPSAGRTPRAAPVAEAATEAATGAVTEAAPVPVPVPGQRQVEVGEIGGKPVLKPRINPNRDQESGYRKRQTPPPPADPPAGGDR